MEITKTNDWRADFAMFCRCSKFVYVFVSELPALARLNETILPEKTVYIRRVLARCSEHLGKMARMQEREGFLELVTYCEEQGISMVVDAEKMPMGCTSLECLHFEVFLHGENGVMMLRRIP